MSRIKRTSGFTAVELLITLFIAAAFLLAGYQLFDAVIRDGAQTRAEARARNIAYEYLRMVQGLISSNPCNNNPSMGAKLPDTDGLTNIFATLSVTCPRPDTPSLNKLTANITYGTEGKSLQVSTYFDASRGATGTQSFQNGLVGWWQFNGDGASQVGPSSYGATLQSTTFAANRLGEANKALYMGAGSRATSSTSDSLSPRSITISLWIHPTAWITSEAATAFVAKRGSSGTTGFILGRLTGTNSVFFDCGGSGERWLPGYSPPLNQWTHLTATCEPGRVAFYVNGSFLSERTSNAASTLNSSAPLTIGEDSLNITPRYYFTGSIDDVRIYNRVLLATEVSQVAAEAR